jgi:phosphohistidine phosphatase
MLLRHAKSSWEDPSLNDFDRPLAPRGEAAAPRIGAYMAEHDLAPELVLCSPAVRARQTLDLVLPHLGGNPTVVYEEAFYLATPAVMLARLRKVEGPPARSPPQRARVMLARLRKVEAKVRRVLVIAHDPGMQALAVELAGTGEPKALQAIAAKFPTAALAVLRFNLGEWAKIRAGKGRLELFITPKTLP